MNCRSRLEKYLHDNGVAFTTRSHHEAYTAEQVAAAEHVPGKMLAKVTVVSASGKSIMLVLPANNRVDFAKLRTLLGTSAVRLAQEPEFEPLFPDCEPGAMPPFGNLYDLPVYVDQTLAEDEEIIFQAGTHHDAMMIKYAEYARLVKPTVADFAVSMPAAAQHRVPG